MHFEDVEQKLSKREIYKRMADYLRINKNYSKVKGKKGIVRKIINDGNIEKAIDNARKLEEQYTRREQTIFSNITDMNPYTSVYKLVEQLMLEISPA